MLAFTVWAFFLSCLCVVNADVSVATPKIGQTFSASGGSTNIVVSWVDDTDDDTSATSLSKVKQYSIVLCTGSSTSVHAVKSLTTNLPSASTSYSATIEDSDGPDGSYFFQVFAKFADGYTIHYTPRFTLSGMSGSANTFTSFAGSYFTQTGPQPTAQIDVGGDATTINSASFTVPYTLQTGKTRFAPMQTQPGSTVTHTMFSTRYQTSAYTPYSTIRPSPAVYSTITPGWSYAVTSVINTASVAGYPTYFYPASSRVVSASASSAKRRRWLE